MKFESNLNSDHNLETKGEGLEREQADTETGLPEGAILIEKPDDFEKQAGGSPLAELLAQLPDDQYSSLVEDVFKPNGINGEMVSQVSDGERLHIWKAIVAFATGKHEADKLRAQEVILDFFGK